MKKSGKISLVVCFVLLVGNLSVMAVNFSPGDDLFFVYSVAYKNLSWDLGGYNLAGERKGGKISLWGDDNGADRFIKLIQHPTQRDYVFFQPQHSFFVADISGSAKTPGAALQLWDHGYNNEAQMFKMIQVNGVADTYYIQNARSGLYLTAQGQGKNITQEVLKSSNEQKWYFKKVNGATMAPPDTGYIYALENVMAKKFIDVPGAAPNQGRKDAELQLWSMDNYPDRYVELYGSGVEDYVYIHPMHCAEVWDAEGGETTDGTDIQLWPLSNVPGQQFRFEYAGEPLTYFIKNRNSNKYVDAYMPKIYENGCQIQIYSKNNQDNQKWRLHIFEKFQMPSPNQTFYVKSAYTNKYWDLRGNEVETNRNGQKLAVWDLDGGSDRKYKFPSAGDARWIKVQFQNGGRFLDIAGQSKDAGAKLHIWDYHDINSQKFAIQFTSPTTFVLRTNNWKAADISNPNGKGWDQNGAEVIQYNVHFDKNQQFQLIYADGPNKGKVYEVEEFVVEPNLTQQQVNDAEVISFSKFNLTAQQQAAFNSRKMERGYTVFPDKDGQIVLGVYTNGSKGTEIIKVEEKAGLVNVYVKESPLQGNDPNTVVKLQTKNSRITVKDINSYNYGYFNLSTTSVTGWEADLVRKYAPQMRFHEDEFSFPSPAEGIINRAYKVSPLTTKEFTKLTTGILPELAMNDQGTVLEIHHTTDRYMQWDGFGSNYSHEIHFRVGTRNADGSISFTGHRKLTTGINPTIAINNNGKVLEAHRHSSNSGIDLRHGVLDQYNKTVHFNNVSNLTNGEHPSVAINDHDLFVMVNERGGQLEYHFGRLAGGVTEFFGTKVSIPHNGQRPSVDINNMGQIVLTYENASTIYYMIGQFNGRSIDFTNPVKLTSGVHPSIELNDNGDIIEVHQTSNQHVRTNPDGSTGLYYLIHYRYGALHLDSRNNPYIEFSQFIELCSGVTPDIVLNNNGEMIEIHQTSSWTNSEIHYRMANLGYKRETVTSLSNLPENQGGYILAQKGAQSWEAPEVNGKQNLKIYAVVTKIGDRIEIGYHFFYPSNGTGITKLESMEHIGDWERIYVVLDSKGNFLESRYHHHSNVDTFKKDKLQFAAGTHPVVYVARETHASYPTLNISIMTGDEVSDDGLHWNSYDNLEIVKIDKVIQNGNKWIHWNGRWGSTLNSPDSKF